MYNNQGIYTITGDMCYENKIMKNAVSSTGPLDETKLNIEEHASQSRRGSKCLGRRKFKFRLAYAINTVCALIVLAVCIFIEVGIIPSRKSGFFCRDPSLSHKFRGDSISPTLLVVVSATTPLCLFLFVESMGMSARPTRQARLAWKWYRDLLIGLFSVLSITQVLKAVAGEPRPHFLYTCQPDANINCTPGSYITDYECTSKDFSSYIISDSFRSFPSGHSCIAMLTSIYCAAYIYIRIHTHQFGMLLKPFLITLFLMWGPVSGLSRITDHRHHWWDVLTGTIMGIIGAIYTIKLLSSNFEVRAPIDKNRTAESTTALFDVTNKGAASVII